MTRPSATWSASFLVIQALSLSGCATTSVTYRHPLAKAEFLEIDEALQRAVPVPLAASATAATGVEPEALQGRIYLRPELTRIEPFNLPLPACDSVCGREVPTSALRRIELRRKVNRVTPRGILLGMAVGALEGGILGLVSFGLSRAVGDGTTWIHLAWPAAGMVIVPLLSEPSTLVEEPLTIELLPAR